MDAHATRIVVWDVPSAIECGAAFRVKVGVKCADECRVPEWRVEIDDADGRAVASAPLSDQPWPGTSALYYADLELPAPPDAGLYAWRATVRPVLDEAGQETHAGALAHFNIRAVPAPECEVKVIAVDARSRAPVPGARVVIHPYRALTNAEGVARLRVSKGSYRLFVSGLERFPFRADGIIDGDVTITAELDEDLGPSYAELWS
jgi:hypothetical protein